MPNIIRNLQDAKIGDEFMINKSRYNCNWVIFKVVKLTPSQVIVRHSSKAHFEEIRFRKKDGGQVAPDAWDCKHLYAIDKETLEKQALSNKKHYINHMFGNAKIILDDIDAEVIYKIIQKYI